MEFLKLFSEDAREPFMENQGGIRACVQELVNRGIEFKVKVDKAQTVPYTVQVEAVQSEGILLHFQRPLPPELAKGALFGANFQMEGHNFQCPIKFQGRAAYLRYLFSWPERIYKLERRKSPRLPFRPREKADATLRDGGVPGLGVSGPLLNLSRAGVCLRVDRVIRLDNGFRLGVSAAHLPPGKFFDAIRLTELPGLPQLDLRGFVVHATEKGGVLILGLSFQESASDALRQLDESLKLRTKLLQAKTPLTPTPALATVAAPPKKAGEGRPGALPAPLATPLEVPASWDSSDVLNEAPPEDDDSAQQDRDPLRLLQRRTLPLALSMPAPGGAEALATWLLSKGFRRLAPAPDGAVPAETLLLNGQPGAVADRTTLVVPDPGSWDQELLPQLESLAAERL